jgi:DNA-binding response OmpR family regulator
VKPVDPEELGATLQSLLRRVGEHRFSIVSSSPLPVQWRVDHVRLTLSGPNGKVCKLSHGEALLLAAVVQAEGQQVSRVDLLAAFDAKGISSSGRRVEAMISRLRGKVMDELHLELPIQSIYGQGYAFLDHALVI